MPLSDPITLPHEGDGPNRTGDVAKIAESMGPFPPIVRYFDEYEEVTRSLYPRADIWTIETNGHKLNLKFKSLDDATALLLKHFAIARLHRNAVTATNIVSELLLRFHVFQPLLHLACRDPSRAIDHLRLQVATFAGAQGHSQLVWSAKAFLYFLCEAGAAGWTGSHANILKSISAPASRSPFRRVRDGSAIISLEEERRIVGYFDDLNASILTGTETFEAETLRDACILFWNFAHGVRPIQIANRNAIHARLRYDPAGQPIVHVTFRYAKQTGSKKAMEQTRKMKRDWTPMMEAWLKQREAVALRLPFDRVPSLFGLPPHKVTLIVADLTERVTGVRRAPYDLRHSAAQRKADAGCSRLELAEFLMHQDIETADAYIEMSPTQAEKINQAYGLSPLFQAVDEALKRRSIDVKQLRALPDDQQIGAAPHGHLIAGIGGCGLGQSYCTKTPALACYECHKFMYLRDAWVHRAARASVTAIIEEFIAVGPVGRSSPAYMQLRRVLETIDAIVDDLEASETGVDA